MELSDIVWEVKKDSIKKIIETGKRSDGRALDEYRKIEMEIDYAKMAEGSCLIKLGNTQILVGVKMDVGEPYPDSPNAGVLITNAELVPLASPIFMPGPPDQNAIELARVVDRGIRESKMIDLEKLCIEPEKNVWNVLVDIHVLDHDGNLLDAALLGAVKALLNTKIPKYENEKVCYAEKTIPLPVKDKPVGCTFANINNLNVIDPRLEEEKIMNSRLTLVTNKEGNLCAIQKGGIGSYSEEEIDLLLDLAIKKGEELRKLL